MRTRTSIKDILVLAKQTLVTAKLGRLFDWQFATFNAIREADKEEEKKMGNVHMNIHPYVITALSQCLMCFRYPIFVKEPLRPSTSDTTKPMDLIAVHMPLKYSVSEVPCNFVCTL